MRSKSVPSASGKPSKCFQHRAGPTVHPSVCVAWSAMCSVTIVAHVPISALALEVTTTVSLPVLRPGLATAVRERKLRLLASFRAPLELAVGARVRLAHDDVEARLRLARLETDCSLNAEREDHKK